MAKFSLMPLSMAFTAQIFTKIKASQRYYVEVSCTKFHPHHSRNMESVSNYSFMPLSKACH